MHICIVVDFSPDSAVIASKQIELENAYNETARLSASRREKLQVVITYFTYLPTYVCMKGHWYILTYIRTSSSYDIANVTKHNDYSDVQPQSLHKHMHR